MKSPSYLIKVCNCIALLMLSCLLTAFESREYDPETIGLDKGPPLENIRIAVLPFQDESTEIQNNTLNSGQFFNHILSSVKQLNDCPQKIDLISKGQLMKSFAVLGQTVDAETGPTSFSYDMLDSICARVETDVMILGEFLVDEEGKVEVFYSYENCKGFYSSEIKYQTAQPIQGSMSDVNQLYSAVSQAIKHDIEVFLACEKQVDVEGLFQSGYERYVRGDSVPSAYARAIEFFNKILIHDPTHQEAIYYSGLAYFGLGEHNKAMTYFTQIPEYKDTPDYLVYCRLGSKPAFWYNTDRKRQGWWEDELSASWRETLNMAVLNKAKDHQPSVAELADIFNKTSIQIVDIPLDNLDGLSALTNITQLSCNKNKLSSLQGVEKLQSLGQLNFDNNKLIHLDGIDRLPLLTRLYVRNNPIKKLTGIEHVDKDRFVLFCSYNVPKEEIKRIKNLGINVQQ